MGIREKIGALTPRQVALIMLFVTLFIPTNNLMGSLDFMANRFVIIVRVTALIWTIDVSYWIINSQVGISLADFSILNPYSMFAAVIYSVFNIIFAVQVVRFCRGQTSKRLTIFIGILTLLFPLVFFTFWIYPEILTFIERSGLLLYIGPLPIQLIIGLIIMRYAGPWKVTKPWEEGHTREDWWKEEQKSGGE